MPARTMINLDTSDFNDPLDLSPRLFWKCADKIENAQLTLKNARLVFTVDVSTTGPIFEAIELGFQNHCATNNIDYIAPTVNAAVPSPNTMSYVLLGPRGRSNGRTWIEDPKSLTRFTFTLQALRSIPYSHTPNNLDGRFWTEREGCLTLRLHPSHTPYRFCISKATGLILEVLLLHFLFIGAPLPASPFLFLTLFDGRAIASKFDVDFLSTFISHTSLGLVKRIVGGPYALSKWTGFEENI
ncbi:hypothetical protein R3P38DRAFT_3496866 [Favolaschia claudopus]|uniref:Uncharacterized protein n=1 Tax=Favolaschia claudopus TaxID=2862362 RepID=A0AAW0C792_9AGAR